MNRYHILAASFLLSTPLTANDLFNHPQGTFFSTNEITELKQHSRLGDDLIVLRDGTQLTGKIPHLPEVDFAFGKLPIKIQDVAAIAFSFKTGYPKIQFITQEGLSFITDVPNSGVSLVQYYPSQENPTHTTHQELDLQTISYILLKKRGESNITLPRHLFSLELKNGDRIPVIIREEKIELNNGWREFSLNVNEIVDVSFDGGLYGRLKDRTGREKELDFSFVKNKHLRVQIAKSTQTLGLPWDHIVAIRKEEFKSLPLDRAISFKSDSIEWDKASKNIAAGNEESKEDLDSKNEELLALVIAEKQRAEDILEQQEVLEKSYRKIRTHSKDLEDEITKLRHAYSILEDQNKKLSSEFEVAQSSKRELLFTQDALLSNLEFELTRTRILRESLNEAYRNWNKTQMFNQLLENKLRRLMGGETVGESQLKENAELIVEVKFLEEALEKEKGLTTDLQKQLTIIQKAFDEEHRQNEDHVAVLKKALSEERASSHEAQSKLEDVTAAAEQLEMEYIAIEQELKERMLEIQDLTESQENLQLALNEQMTSLSEERSQLESSKTKLTEEIQSTQELLEKEKEQTCKLEEDLCEVTGKAKEIEDRYLELEQSLKEKSIEFEEVQSMHQTQSNELSEKVEYLNAAKEHSETIKYELEKKLEDLQQTLLNENAHATDLEMQLEEMKMVTQLYQEKLDELKEMLSKKTNEFETLQTTHNNLLASLKNKSVTIDKEADDLITLQAQWERKEQDLTELLNIERAEKELLQSQLNELMESVQSYQYQLDNLQETFQKEVAQEDETQLLELQEKINDLSQQLESEQSLKRELEARLEAMSENVHDYQHQLEALRETFQSELEQEKEVETTYLQRNLEEMNQQLKREQTGKEELEGKLVSMAESINTYEKQIENLRDEHSKEINTKVSELTERLNEEKLEREQLENQIARMTEKIHSYQGQFESMRQSLLSKEEVNDTYQERIHELSATKDVMEAQLNELRESLQKKNQEIEVLQLSRDNLLSSLKYQTDQITQEKEGIEVRYQQLKSQFESQIAEVDEKRNRIHELENQIGQATQKAKSVEEQYGSLKEKLNAKEREVEQLKNRLGREAQHVRHLEKELSQRNEIQLNNEVSPPERKEDRWKNSPQNLNRGYSGNFLDSN